MPKQATNANQFRLDDCVGYLLHRAKRAMSERIEAEFAARGVTFQQWAVLMRLRDGIASTVSELCRDTAHDSGAMTRLVDQLEQRGFIERQRNSDDRRVVKLKLTAAGRKFAESLTPIAIESLDFALDGFSKQEVKQLQTFLRRIIDRLRDTDDKEADESAEVKA